VNETMPKHMINFKSWSREELLEIIDKSIEIKKNPEKI